MISLQKTTFYLFITFIINVSCTRTEKDSISFKQKIKEMNIVPSEYYTINSSRDTLLEGGQGTKITIPKLTFCDENGNILPEIKIELREFYKLSDMMFSNLTTMSNGKIIETGGMIYINATSENKKLEIVKGKNITVEFKTNYNSEMKVFSGETDSLGNINWYKQNEKRLNEDAPRVDTIPYSPNLHNILTSNTLGWVNCDKFLSFPETTDIFVKNQNGIDTNVFCGLILKKYNSIIPSTFTNNNAVKFHPVPLNEEAIIILLSFKQDKYSYGFKDVVLSKKATYDISMNFISKEELIKKLSQFDKLRPLF